MSWHDGGKNIGNEGGEKAENEIVTETNSISENKKSLQDLGATDGKDLKRKLTKEILTENETVQELKYGVNVVVTEGAERKKTTSDEPMVEPGEAEENVNEVEDKEPKKHVEPSIKIEKKPMIGSKI